ncbi:chromosome segregation protein SMC [Sanguibacter sp. HDW7]|uniref:chromosome segregation protein SMC n=1 Tax=Sanguibacter sp. HDW7 TaxID=2714931 RepID=UPI00140DBDB6|nr:chromosome segregation protein SMC [Sanguibacter sp. HDW7]QIK83217.1 chromosome segregation protein SMC [Sanguibacter sp. HDW7]
MHLKTLTLRGFKSFASATTLSLEPGVTCVVGPNGSGKSNVVDALAWVMGEQGAKTLRGGKMEDVIFAGTSGRPPLGRAEVSLTIDNSDGALPIEYSEVTITRTLFRNGGSEYQINGAQCRLLDIQELLSDSGLGREMHVIVGQGRLDSVLRATPEERRGFIEEAAGVLKHRKRKEKALRKLDSMQGNLVRLGDLTTEIRRQLGPLGKQAEVARRAQAVQADVRDARARLLADDLVQLTSTLEQEKADETALRAETERVERELAEARSELAALEAAAAEAAPRLTEIAETWYRLSSLRERLRGTQQLATERVRLLGAPEPAEQRSDPRVLEEQAERVRASEAELQAEVEAARATLDAALEARTVAETAAKDAERAVATLLRGAADRREGLARLAGQVAAKRSRAEARAAEIERLREAADAARARGEAAAGELGLLETEVEDVEEGEEGLDAAHEAALEVLEAARATLTDLRERLATARQDAVTARARTETLELSLDRKDAVGAVLASDDVALAEVLGSLAALLTVEPGYEEAVAAALGPVADALAVGSVGGAVDVVRWLRTDDAGRASLVVAGVDAPEGPTVPDGSVLLADVVTTSAALAGAVRTLLAGHVVVDDLVAARTLVTAHPALTAVTRAGDVLGAVRAHGGSAAAPSVLHLQAALDASRAALADAERRETDLAARIETAAAREAEASDVHEEALDRLHESDAAIAAIAERLGHLGAGVRAAQAEADRAGAALEQAQAALVAEQAEHAELAARLEVAEAEPADSEEAVAEATAARDAAQQRATEARAAETEARLTLRTSEERARALAGRAASLDRAAAAERQAAEKAQRRAARRAAQASRAQAVATGAALAVRTAEESLAAATVAREQAEAERTARDGRLAEVRARVESHAGRLRDLTDVAHRDELARAQQLLRIEQLHERAVAELGLDPEVLVDEHGPDRPVPALAEDGTPEVDEDGTPVTRPYVRTEQEKRLARAERDLARLGRVNPLALEEFAALEERHRFLVEQLDDLKRSRADLLQIVKEIDDRVERVFADAFRDTAAQFERVFARMFPGGEGRLVLTDPENMLTTGLEVEARPAGKKVKRLSLLSGGERSLTAVALLVAIFKARPSPFYVMDEVEAALDDTNLGRLLEVFRELQEDSQLIVVTHQKRTMEIADALYGVTMRDGVTTVVSQRLREDVA